MTTATCTHIRWKNTRKRSYYDKEGLNGFIYRVPPPVIADSDNTRNPSEDIKQESRREYDKEGLSGFIYRLPPAVTADSTAGDNQSEEFQHDAGDQVELEDVARQVEIDQFLAELRRALVKAGSNLTEEQLDVGFKQLSKDLMEDNLYVRCMEEVEKVSTGPSEEESHVPQHIAALTRSIDKYKKELAEWSKVLEERKQVTEKAKEGYSKERYINFLTLSTRDEDPLKSFFSPEQLSLIESHTPSEFVTNTNQELDRLEERLDQELARLSSICSESNQSKLHLDQSVMMATPRTLFRDVKLACYPNQTLS